jgi:small-conductance mechanosensitive channel
MHSWTWFALRPESAKEAYRVFQNVKWAGLIFIFSALLSYTTLVCHLLERLLFSYALFMTLSVLFLSCTCLISALIVRDYFRRREGIEMHKAEKQSALFRKTDKVAVISGREYINNRVIRNFEESKEK